NDVFVALAQQHRRVGRYAGFRNIHKGFRVSSDQTLILSGAHARLGTEPNWRALDTSNGQTAHEIEENQAERPTLVGTRDPCEQSTPPERWCFHNTEPTQVCRPLEPVGGPKSAPKIQFVSRGNVHADLLHHPGRKMVLKPP